MSTKNKKGGRFWGGLGGGRKGSAKPLIAAGGVEMVREPIGDAVDGGEVEALPQTELSADDAVVDQPREEVVQEPQPAEEVPEQSQSEIGATSDNMPIGGKSFKKPKKLKDKTVRPSKLEDEISLPLNVAVDFYRGVTKVRDAEQIARAFVEKNFDAPNAAYVYVQKWRDGCAVEMQEGGGKAYLPEVLAMLDDNDDALIALPMSGRVLQVNMDRDTKNLQALILTSGQLPSPDAFIALPTRPMTPFDKRGSKVFIVGMGLFLASMISLVFSVGAFFIDTKAWSIPHVYQTNVKVLPSAQSPKVLAALEGADCIAKMEYRDGKWTILAGWDDGTGLCSSSARQANPPVDAGIADPSLSPPVVGADNMGVAPMPAGSAGAALPSALSPTGGK